MNGLPMGQKHEQRRLEADQQLDRLLQTKEGRSQYWAELLDACKECSMISLLESTLHLPGDVIECGVYRGGTLTRICRTISRLAADKQVLACDSFEGFPDYKVGRIDVGYFRFLSRIRKKFGVCDDVPARLERFFNYYGIRGRIEKGYFSETLHKFSQHRFCFIHLDVDIYDSYIECLSKLYSQLVPGVVVVFDDYGSPKWPGAKKAVDEFFADREESPCKSAEKKIPAWFVRKPLEKA